MKKKSKAQIVKMNFDRILREKNLKQKDVAARMHVEPQTLSGYFRTDNITDDTIGRIAGALEVDTSKLFMSEEKNLWMSLAKERELYFRTTWRGRIIMLLSILFLAYVIVMFKDIVITLFGVLSMLLVLDNFGIFDPSGEGKLLIIEKILKVLIRISEIISVFLIIVYGILDRLAG